MSERASSKTSILCAVFTYPSDFNGVETNVYLTDSPAEFQMVYKGGLRTFTPDRYLDYASIERNGTVDEDQASLITSADWGFATGALRGDPIQPMEVHVFELITDKINDNIPSSVSILHWDQAKVASITNKDNAEVGACTWTLLNVKTQTDRTLNTRATENCPARLGDGKVCLFNLEGNRSSATIIGYIDKTITLTGLRAEPDAYWKDGFVQFDGLNLKIREAEGNVLTLYVPLPEDLRLSIAAGGTKAVRVYPGCTGSFTECVMYGQTSRFWGLGIDMETRNPLFQLPR